MIKQIFQKPLHCLHCMFSNIHNKIILTLFCFEIFTVNMEHFSRGFRILQLSYEKTDGNTENLAEYRTLNKKQIVADNHLKSGEPRTSKIHGLSERFYVKLA